jgi:hypothetical protein
MTTNHTPSMKNTEAVRNHAIENYNNGGWDYIVECYSDEDIQRVLNYDGVQEGDTEAAIEALDFVRKIYFERQEEVLSTVW